MLDSNEKSIEPFLREAILKIRNPNFVQFQHWFSRKNYKNNSNKNSFSETKFKKLDVENLYREFAGFDMSYDEINDLCRECRKDEKNFTLALIDHSSKNKSEGKFCVCRGNTPKIYIDFLPKTKLSRIDE